MVERYAVMTSEFVTDDAHDVLVDLDDVDVIDLTICKEPADDAPEAKAGYENAATRHHPDWKMLAQLDAAVLHDDFVLHEVECLPTYAPQQRVTVPSDLEDCQPMAGKIATLNRPWPECLRLQPRGNACGLHEVLW